MKTKICIMFFMMAATVYAQQPGGSEVTATMRDILNGRGGTISPANGSRTVFGVKSESGNVLGNVYLDTTWREGTIKLYQKIGPLGKEGDIIAQVPIRYDLYLNEIEVLGNHYRDIRATAGNQVKFFAFNDPLYGQRLFVNLKEFEVEDGKEGFVEELVNGKLPLYHQYRLKIVKPTYNEALSVGNKDAKILKEQNLYLLNGKKLMKFNPSKKKVLELMGDKGTAVEKFVASKELNYKNANHLKRIFEFYKSL